MNNSNLTQKLALKQEQILSPAQMQSLEFLMTPATELQSKIEKELSLNPVLEDENNQNLINSYVETNNTNAIITSPFTASSKTEFDTKLFKDKEIVDLLELSKNWNNNVSNSDSYSDLKTEEEKYHNLFDSLVETQTIENDLLEQLSFSNANEHLKTLAKLIIGNINEYGYFEESLKNLAVQNKTNQKELQNALTLVQSFEPPGIAARNLQECLLIQLERKGQKKSLESQIIKSHLEDLAQNHLPQIAKKLNVSIEQLKDAIVNIRKLSPFPWTNSNARESNSIIVPDITIEKKGQNQFVAIFNKEYLPRLKISDRYIKMLEDPNTANETREYIKQKILQANTIIKNLNQRQETIKKITQVIIDTQFDFLEKGIKYLKPMFMRQVADKIGMHETTVGRAVSKKYVRTPQGIFELKYFFTSGYQTDNGELISNKSVIEKIKAIIAHEDTAKPLSDDDISEKLKKEGLHIARRTVTKYREAMGMPSSRLRKEYE